MKKRIFLCIILAIIMAVCVLPMSVSAADLPDIQNINYVGFTGTVSWEAVTHVGDKDVDVFYFFKIYDATTNECVDNITINVSNGSEDVPNYYSFTEAGIPSGSYYVDVAAAYIDDTVTNSDTTFITNRTKSSVFTHTDNTPPAARWDGTAERTSASSATVPFNNPEKYSACTYYYAIVESGAAAPTVDTSGEGISAESGENTVNVTGLTSVGAYDIYLVLKDQDGNVSEPIMTTIPECTNYVIVNGVILDASAPYYKNGAASATSNSDNPNVNYDAVTKNLYLSDAVITQGYTVSGAGTAGIYTPTEITIYLGGNNTISGVANGIVSDKPLTVGGAGALTVTLSEGDGSGIRTRTAGDTLTINGGKYNISGGKYGVRSNGDMTLTPEILKVSTLQDAIHSEGSHNITISDGDLDLTITSTSGCGIYGNAVTISCDKLKINSACYGIYCFEIKFAPASGNFINIMAGTTAECADYNARYKTETNFTRDDFMPYKHVITEHRKSYFEDVNISLGVDITVHYYTLKSDLVAPEMRFTINGYTKTVAGVLENGQYKFSFDGVAPQWMGDNISAELLVEGEVEDVKNYTVLTYLNALKATSASELGYSEEKYNAMVTLINDLLVYGGAAQNYTEHKTDALVSEGITGTEFVTLNETDKQVTNTDEVNFSFACVYFDSTNDLRFYFSSPDISKVVFKLKVNGGEEKEVEDVLLSGTYCIKTDAISATGFDDVYTLTAYVDGAPNATLTYSVKSYVYTYQSSYAVAEGLVKATYNYGLAAKAFAAAQ